MIWSYLGASTKSAWCSLYYHSPSLITLIIVISNTSAKHSIRLLYPLKFFTWLQIVCILIHGEKFLCSYCNLFVKRIYNNSLSILIVPNIFHYTMCYISVTNSHRLIWLWEKMTLRSSGWFALALWGNVHESTNFPLSLSPPHRIPWKTIYLVVMIIKPFTTVSHAGRSSNLLYQRTFTRYFSSRNTSPMLSLPSNYY